MENNMYYGVDMSKEEWRDIPGLEGVAQASNWGRVRTVDRYVTYNNGRKAFYTGKILSISRQGQVNISGHLYMVNKLIANTFIPDYVEGLHIINNDSNKTNCRLDNIDINVLCYAQRNNPLPYKIKLHGDKIEGGFSKGQRILLDITIANTVEKPLHRLREDNIKPNLKNMTKGIDYLDLIEYSDINEYLQLLIDLGYEQKNFERIEHIYIFSERGVAKVMSSLHNTNPAKWEFLNNFVNEYFNMREQLQNQVPQLTEKQLCILALYEGGAEAVTAGKRLSEIEVQEATAPLLDTIEKQAPKVDKFDKYMESDGTYNATNTAKLLNISSAQKFNNLLKEMKIQYKTGKNWVLYSKYQWLIDEGYCKYIEGENSNYSYMQLRWYPKGVDWLRTQIQ